MRAAAYILSVKFMKELFCKRKLFIPILLAVCSIPLAVIYSGACAEGIRKGIGFCTEVLVPSLCVFMGLTAYLIKSGAAGAIAKPFGPLMRMMGLPREAAAAVVPAMIGGYPIGAGCVAMLYRQGQLSDSEARKCAYIAVAAGPGFLVNYVGRALLGSTAAGNLLLASHLIAVLLTGALVGATVRCSPPPRRGKIAADSGDALVEAVRSAADATFVMCATVVLFSAVIEVVGNAVDGGTADVLCAFLEVTAGCSRMSGKAPLYVTAFFVGFGGVAVHCQIFAALGEVRVRCPLFFLFRAAQGIFAAAAAYILLMITPMQTAVFSSSDVPLAAGRSATYAGSGALILAALCFIGTISSKLRRLKVCAE